MFRMHSKSISKFTRFSRYLSETGPRDKYHDFISTLERYLGSLGTLGNYIDFLITHRQSFRYPRYSSKLSRFLRYLHDLDVYLENQDKYLCSLPRNQSMESKYSSGERVP